MEHKKSLKPNQIEAITALLENETVKEAAALAGVCRTTVYRWLRDPDFQQALRAGEGAILDKVSRRLILLADKAVTALESVIDEPMQEGASQKRFASQAILDNVLKLWELRNVESRLSELEKRVNDEQK